MTEPTPETLYGLYIGQSLAWLAPQINIDALFGAILGGWVVTSARHTLKSWQHLGSFLLSAAVGYLFSPLLLAALAPLASSGVAAFVSALLVVPISIKVMIWVDATDLLELIRRLRGGK